MRNRLVVLISLALCLVLSGYGFAQTIATDGLVSYWDMNQDAISGETVEDVWGDNDGLLVGQPAIVEGKYGDAVELDGAGQYVEIADHESLQLWEAHTLEAWIFQRESRSSRIIDKITAGTADGPHLDTHPGTTLRSCAGNCVSATTAYSLEEWHHVVNTFDKGEVKLYLDGSVEGEGQVGSPLSGNAVSFKIGADSNGANLFVGIVDEVRVYNRALSEDEVSQNMQAEGLAVRSAGKLAVAWGWVKTSK